MLRAFMLRTGVPSGLFDGAIMKWTKKIWKISLERRVV